MLRRGTPSFSFSHISLQIRIILMITKSLAVYNFLLLFSRNNLKLFVYFGQFSTAPFTPRSSGGCSMPEFSVLFSQNSPVCAATGNSAVLHQKKPPAANRRQ
ncbi:hypothetical protein [Fournierella massiliensis]|uniref:hypothetical protein n=1 Tax=Allofournierella massiliensis TaxID=1650663 RepID=UPI00351FEBDF